MPHDGRDRKRLVSQFLRAAFTDLDVAAAADRLDVNYVQHNPDVGDGRAAFVSGLQALHREFPSQQLAVDQIFAQGDYVAATSEWQLDPDLPERRVVDLFRLEGDLLAEHWDVISPPSDARNPTPPVQAGWLTVALGESTLPRFSLHPEANPTGACFELRVPSEGLSFTPKRSVMDESGLVVHSHLRSTDARLSSDYVRADVFKLAGGRLTPHWVVEQPIRASTQNRNGML